MRKIIYGLILFCLALTVQSCGQLPSVRISIFSQHLEQMVKQTGKSYYEIAKALKDSGYEGIECVYNIDPDHLRILDELGFEHSCAIAHINITEADHQEELDQAFQFMQDHDFKQILLVPGLLEENPTQAELDVLLKRWNAFAEKAQKLGFRVLVECYNNKLSPVGSKAGVQWALENVKGLKQAFDMGNIMLGGDEPWDAFLELKPTIAHVHLKDRPEMNSNAFSNVGYGIAPMKEIISDLRHDSYRGWYAIELYGSKDFFGDALISIESVKRMIE